VKIVDFHTQKASTSKLDNILTEQFSSEGRPSAGRVGSLCHIHASNIIVEKKIAASCRHQLTNSSGAAHSYPEPRHFGCGCSCMHWWPYMPSTQSCSPAQCHCCTLSTQLHARLPLGALSASSLIPPPPQLALHLWPRTQLHARCFPFGTRSSASARRHLAPARSLLGLLLLLLLAAAALLSRLPHLPRIRLHLDATASGAARATCSAPSAPASSR
jgi:hypothetical protein